MRAAIVIYAVVALALLAVFDWRFPVWPVHALAGLAAVVVVAMAVLAHVASRPRR